MRTYKQRLNHLMQSEFIRSFDEYDPVTGIYKRDITDADRKIFYLCDGKACGENHNCGECSHTTDVTHAKNFKYDGLGGYWEQPTITVKDIEPLINEIIKILPGIVNACIDHLPEFIEENRLNEEPPTDPETEDELPVKCPFVDKTNCGYYPYGCGKCPVNNP